MGESELSVRRSSVRGMYHPWRHLSSMTDVRVVFREMHGELGTCSFDDRIITLNAAMGPAQRRCTLAHELVHLERGGIPIDPVMIAREEAAVDRIAAYRLIDLDALVSALSWAASHAEAAEVLHVDKATLECRLANLSAIERADVESRMSDGFEAC